MPVAPRQELTGLLQGLESDDPQWPELLGRVYGELRNLANQQLVREREGHTLGATALVHEAYLKLAGGTASSYENRRHFFGAAAEAMRRVLVDHARRARSHKRGGDRRRMAITLDALEVDTDPSSFLALDEAMAQLAVEDARAAEVTRLRFFAGLEVAEIARLLDVSDRTIRREWSYARARLSEILSTRS